MSRESGTIIRALCCQSAQVYSACNTIGDLVAELLGRAHFCRRHHNCTHTWPSGRRRQRTVPQDSLRPQGDKSLPLSLVYACLCPWPCPLVLLLLSFSSGQRSAGSSCLTRIAPPFSSWAARQSCQQLLGCMLLSLPCCSTDVAAAVPAARCVVRRSPRNQSLRSELGTEVCSSTQWDCLEV